MMIKRKFYSLQEIGEMEKEGKLIRVAYGRMDIVERLEFCRSGVVKEACLDSDKKFIKGEKK